MRVWKTQPKLRAQFEAGALPRHVAVIMDGNGRWAQQRGLPRPLGHRAGVERLKSVIRLISGLGIGYLSVYAFSTENWKRPQDEVGALMGLLVEYMEKEIDELDENNVRILTMGNLSALPREVQAAIEAARARTADNIGLAVCFALSYGSRGEIVRAAQLLARRVRAGELEPAAIDEECFCGALYASVPDPDLVIRTGGECRLSNFMLYQAAYAELLFLDTLWPDFDDAVLLRALHAYTKRTRRFGGV